MKILLNITICLTSLFGPLLAHGQTSTEGMIYIKQTQAQLKQNALFLEMKINIHGIEVNKKQSLFLHPTLVSNADTLELPPIIINGTSIQKKAYRAIALHGEYKPQKEAYTTIKSDPTTHQLIIYRDTIAFQPWMKEAGLILIGRVKDKKNNDTQIFINDLATKLNLFD